MTAGLVGTSGFAAIPTTALDLPLVQRLQRPPRSMGPGPHHKRSHDSSITGSWRRRKRATCCTRRATSCTRCARIPMPWDNSSLNAGAVMADVSLIAIIGRLLAPYADCRSTWRSSTCSPITKSCAIRREPVAKLSNPLILKWTYRAAQACCRSDRHKDALP